MSQSNTQTGDIALDSLEALTGLEGYLAKIANDSNVAKAALPDSIEDVTPFVIIDGAAAGSPSGLRPMDPERSVRLKLKATCVPGDILVLAIPDGTDDGKVRKLPTAAGTYRGIAIAEEVGVEGQLVLARPAQIGNITVNV